MNKRLSRTAEELAHHEAGHAVMGYVLGARFDRVTVDEGNPHVDFPDPDADTLAAWTLEARATYAESEMLIGFAGPIITAWIRGRRLTAEERWWSIDLFENEHRARVASKTGLTPETPRAYFDRLMRRARALASTPRFRAATVALAHALMERRSLTYAEAEPIIASAVAAARRHTKEAE